MKTNKQKEKKNRKEVAQNPYEALKEIGAGTVSSIVQDLGQEGFKDFLRQALKFESGSENKLKGDLNPGEELDLTSVKKEERPERKAAIEPGIDYVRETIHTERITRSRDQQIERSLAEIRAEIVQLIGKTKELSIKFKEVTVEQLPNTPGRYHLYFFEWVLSSIKIARKKVEDSSAWLAAFSSKKSKKQYWAMEKKHGTSFSLSNERVVATQTG